MPSFPGALPAQNKAPFNAPGRRLILLLSGLLLLSFFLIADSWRVEPTDREPCHRSAIVLTAAHDLQAGTVLRREDFIAQTWEGPPRESEDKRVPRSLLDDVVGRVLIERVRQGDPLLLSHVAPRSRRPR